MTYAFAIIAMTAVVPPQAAARLPIAPPPVAGPVARPFSPARSNVPLGALISIEDYPAAARRYDLEGRTAVVLAIDAVGRVDGCTVAQSSGHAVLDVATCRLLASRARFVPARDARGRAVRDSVRTAIRWALPPRPVPVPVGPPAPPSTTS